MRPNQVVAGLQRDVDHLVPIRRADSWRISFTCFRKPHSCNGFCRVWKSQYHSSKSLLHLISWCSCYVVFTLTNKIIIQKECNNTGTERNRLHGTVQNHHYAPTAVAQWLQKYHTTFHNITIVRNEACWRSSGSESPLSTPRPSRRTSILMLLSLKTVINKFCLILARLLETTHFLEVGDAGGGNMLSLL